MWALSTHAPACSENQNIYSVRNETPHSSCLWQLAVRESQDWGVNDRTRVEICENIWKEPRALYPVRFSPDAGQSGWGWSPQWGRLPSLQPGLPPAAEPRGCVFVGLECLRQCPSSAPRRPLRFSFGLPGTVDPPRLTQANAGWWKAATTGTPASEPSWLISTQEALEIRWREKILPGPLQSCRPFPSPTSDYTH